MNGWRAISLTLVVSNTGSGLGWTFSIESMLSFGPLCNPKHTLHATVSRHSGSEFTNAKQRFDVFNIARYLFPVRMGARLRGT